MKTNPAIFNLALMVLLGCLGVGTASGQTVTTDKSDYSPGSTVQIAGSGFQAGEIVQLQVLNLTDPSDTGPEHDPWQVAADENGNLQATWYVTPDEAGATLQLTATGLTSGLTAQTTFTDSAAVTTSANATISADTTGGTFTVLTGPVLTEGADGDIRIGTIVLNAPAGFAFDTTVPVTVTVSGSGTGEGGIVILSNTVASVTASAITIGVSNADAGRTYSSQLTWSGIRVRPTAGTPLASGNITNSGTAAITGVTNTTSFGTLTEIAGSASQLAITTSPMTIAAGTQSGTITVQSQDQFGNPQTNATAVTVNLASSSPEGVFYRTNGTLVITSTNILVNQTTASYFYKDTVAGTPVITNSATGLTSATQTETVNPLAGTNLVFTTQPANTAVGQTMANVVVQIKDAFGNNVSSNGVSIALALNSGSFAGGNTTTNTGADGSATFNNLAVNVANTYTLTASSANKTSTNSTPFIISAATANAYRITDAAGGSPTASLGDQLTIKLVDQFGNTVISFSGDKTLTFTGLSTADDGTHPTVTGKTGSAVALGMSEAITFASGVSSAGGSLVAYKAEGPVTLNVSDSGGLASTSIGGTGASLTIANANPVATDLNVARTAGTRLLVALASLTNHWSDANHDLVTLQFVTTNTPGGAVLTTNSSFILCPSNAPNVSDTISYSIGDGHGGTGTGHINVTINAFALGQTNTITVGPGTVVLTFYGIPGYTYTVQRSSDLSSWSDLTNVLDNTGPFTATDSAPSNPAYYRLKWQP